MKYSPTRNRLVSFLCLAGLSMATTSAFAAVPPCDYPFICVGTTPTGGAGSFSTEGATVAQFYSTAVGQGANAAQGGSAFGTNANAFGVNASAFGYNASASGFYASTFGTNAIASGTGASAFGTNAIASEASTSAFGYNANASEADASAFGKNANASGTGASAFGSQANAAGASTTAFGDQSSALGNWSSAFGAFANASEDGASAFGMGSQASYMGSAFGYQAVATQGASFAAGANVLASGFGAIGIGNNANANLGIAIGQEAKAASPSNATTQSIALGYKASAMWAGSVVLGSNAVANNYDCVALGMGSTCDYTGTVSFGSAGNERRLMNMAPGLELTDGVNFGQLSAVADALGGGAYFNNGVFTPPSYLFISGASYNNVGSALADLDGRVHTLETTPSGAGVPGPKGDKGDTGATGPQGPQGPAGADGKDGTNGTNGTNGVDGKDGAPGAKGDKGDPGINGKDGTNGTNGTNGKDGTGNGTDVKAVHYDSLADGSVDTQAVTLQGTDGTTVSNVSDGRVDATSMDAVNGRQLFQAQTDARTYTDKGVQEAKDWAKDYTDQRMRELNGRFDTTQAMAAAQSSLASQLGALNGRNRIGAAAGFAGGHNGIAVGYQHVNEKGNVAFGVHGSVAGRDRAVGVGVGYSW